MFEVDVRFDVLFVFFIGLDVRFSFYLWLDIRFTFTISTSLDLTSRLIFKFVPILKLGDDISILLL